MARAIMRKEVGDAVVVRRPKGDAEFLIVDVRYERFED
jgi:transcription elongation GreA/GreB family factor